MRREPRKPAEDEREIGVVPFGGALAPAMVLRADDTELHVYERARDGGDLRYVISMPIPNGAKAPVVITNVAPDTWISGVGLNLLRDQAAQLWRSRPPR